MTFLELQNLVSYYLDDLAFGYFTPVQVKLWLNLAQQETQKRLIKAGQNYYLQCVTTSLVANQKYYALPEDFKKLHRLELIISGVVPNETTSPLTPITTNQQDLVPSQTGTPGYYSIQRNNLALYPTPESVLTMRLYYSYDVVNMVLDTDVPDVPPEYHELIALIAAETGFMKDGRSSELLVKKLSDYDKMLDTDANERQQDTGRMVVETDSYSDTGAFYW